MSSCSYILVIHNSIIIILLICISFFLDFLELAPVFHEFIKRYVTTMDKMINNGALRPKVAPPISVSSSCTSPKMPFTSVSNVKLSSPLTSENGITSHTPSQTTKQQRPLQTQSETTQFQLTKLTPIVGYSQQARSMLAPPTNCMTTPILSNIGATSKDKPFQVSSTLLHSLVSQTPIPATNEIATKQRSIVSTKSSPRPNPTLDSSTLKLITPKPIVMSASDSFNPTPITPKMAFNTNTLQKLTPACKENTLLPRAPAMKSITSTHSISLTPKPLVPPNPLTALQNTPTPLSVDSDTPSTTNLSLSLSPSTILAGRIMNTLQPNAVELMNALFLPPLLPQITSLLKASTQQVNARKSTASTKKIMANDAKTLLKQTKNGTVIGGKSYNRIPLAPVENNLVENLDGMEMPSAKKVKINNEEEILKSRNV